MFEVIYSVSYEDRVALTTNTKSFYYELHWLPELSDVNQIKEIKNIVTKALGDRSINDKNYVFESIPGEHETNYASQLSAFE